VQNSDVRINWRRYSDKRIHLLSFRERCFSSPAKLASLGASFSSPYALLVDSADTRAVSSAPNLSISISRTRPRYVAAVRWRCTRMHKNEAPRCSTSSSYFTLVARSIFRVSTKEKKIGVLLLFPLFFSAPLVKYT